MILSLHFPPKLRFSDEELVDFCLANPDLNVERDEKGEIHLMSPAHGLTSANNSEILTEVTIWNRKTKAGKVFDSSGGFFLPDTSMRAPDVAWVSIGRWEALSKKEKHSFPSLAPDFVIELESDTDSLPKLKSKMKKWIANGVRLAWLISMSQQKTFIYWAEGKVDKIAFSKKISGAEVLPGFEVVLSDIFEI
jgi:Uma2 family endonuclease